MECIRVENVRKSYGEVVALDGVSLSIPCGSRVAILGPNGAGKSTLLKVIVGLLTPDSGKVYIKGYEPRSEDAKRAIGYLPEDAYPYPYLTVKENLEYIATLRGISDVKGVREKMVDLLDLKEYEKIATVKLSRGNRQKLAIALAILHNPEILILDEPLNYLDIPTQERVISLFTTLNSTFLIATHILSIALRLTKEVFIINHGNIVWKGDIEDLKRLALEEDEPIEKVVTRLMGK